MDQEKLEKFSEKELFDLQNNISEIIKKRNLENGDVDAIIDKAFDTGFPKFDEWSWESHHMISDVIRRDQSSKHFKQHSITLISPFEGLRLQVISQKSQQGKHLVDGIESFIFENGKLSKTMTKTSRSRDH